MAFGRREGEGEGQGLTYGSYLRVGHLTELQVLQSQPAEHDELLFIIIHQVYELWFKQMTRRSARTGCCIAAWRSSAC